MSCEECERSREIDGEEPSCETCPIPPLTEGASRIMAIREKLIRLKDLVDPATVLSLYGVTIDDLDLLAKVEEIIASLNPVTDG